MIRSNQCKRGPGTRLYPSEPVAELHYSMKPQTGFIHCHKPGIPVEELVKTPTPYVKLGSNGPWGLYWERSSHSEVFSKHSLLPHLMWMTSLGHRFKVLSKGKPNCACTASKMRTQVLVSLTDVEVPSTSK